MGVWGCRVVGRRNGSKEPVSQNNYKRFSKLESGRAWELLAQSSPEISSAIWWPPSIRLKTSSCMSRGAKGGSTAHQGS